jgi:hypothetical protein
MAGKPLTTSFLASLPPHIAQVITGHRDINVTSATRPSVVTSVATDPWPRRGLRCPEPSGQSIQ